MHQYRACEGNVMRYKTEKRQQQPEWAQGKKSKAHPTWPVLWILKLHLYMKQSQPTLKQHLML